MFSVLKQKNRDRKKLLDMVLKQLRDLRQLQPLSETSAWVRVEFLQNSIIVLPDSEL